MFCNSSWVKDNLLASGFNTSKDEGETTPAIGKIDK